MLTSEQLRSIMPRLSPKRNGEYLPLLQAAMAEFAIDTPARTAAFLAQLAHESGQFRFMEELWGPTPAQRRYEPQSSLAAALGNTTAGDGKRFKGRGPIQITGRANYRRFGDVLSVDLLSAPERAAVPDLAFRIAGLYWAKKGLNELADRATPDAFREITRRINGGFNGFDDRQRYYAIARTTLGVAEAPGASRDLPVPGPAEEPAFERGHEAIRAYAVRRRARRVAPVRRQAGTRQVGTRQAGTRQASGRAHRAAPGSPARKASSRGKLRKAANAPRRAPAPSRPARRKPRPRSKGRKR